MTFEQHQHVEFHRGILPLAQAPVTVVMRPTNKSGGSIAIGDVVVVDTTNDCAFTTTTSAQATLQIGIAQETIANNAAGLVAIGGYVALVNVTASVTRGRYAETSTTAKKATQNTTRRQGSFAVFLTGGATPAAWLFGVPDGSSGGGGGSMTVEQIGGSPSTPSVTVIEVGAYTDNGGGDVTLFPGITGVGLGTISFLSAILQLVGPAGDAGVNIIDGGLVQLFGDHTPGTGVGARFSVGSDELNVDVREETSARAQLTMDSGSGYNVEIVDDPFSNGSRTPGRWVFLDDGGNVSIPSLGMARQFSSAPTAQFEGETYYDTTAHVEYVWDGTTWQALW